MSGDRTCPSARCTPGATLLGIKGADGHIRHMRQGLEIDAAFVEEATRHGPPEARMRFANRCETSGCSQWTGDRCGVIDRVLGFLQDAGHPLSDSLPPCPIRATCRWFDQSGDTACRACDLVVTDQRALAAE